MVNLMNGILMAAAVSAEAAVQAGAEVGAAAKTHWGVIGVLGAVLAVGLIIFGAARGISKIASAAVEAIARQPEAGGRIFTSMLLASALIEGGMLFGLIVCLMAILSLT
jgi:F-type H+-transporting ATPase subunit c